MAERGQGVKLLQRGETPARIFFRLAGTVWAAAGSAPMPQNPICLPPPSRAAFLLDFDGTLVDIAPRPEQVVVPPSLPGHLLRLRALCGGALGLVSGRPIAQIEAFLGAHFAVAGEHGTAIRHAPDEPIEDLPLPDLPPRWMHAAEAAVAAYPGTHLEPKRNGFVLHYRCAPEAGGPLRAVLTPLVAEQPHNFHVAPSKMAWELRPKGLDKGTAVRALMARPPFAGRLPIFVGDDVTDEDGMREARALGGLGLRVPDMFNDAAGVRAWLARLADAQTGADAWPA
jgi:trehalose 6-phosphate phosphatase